jgi:hypothetical protein
VSFLGFFGLGVFGLLGLSKLVGIPIYDSKATVFGMAKIDQPIAGRKIKQSLAHVLKRFMSLRLLWT